MTDEEEPPAAPDAPTFSEATEDMVVVHWVEPANTGPPIADYDVRWRVSGSGDDAWTEIDDAVPSTALTATIAGLTSDTAHEVQVRADNGEGESDWSPSGTATTGANAPPAFEGDAAFGVDENETDVGTVSASDPDAADPVTGYRVDGADGALFSITPAGALAFVDAPDFENPRGMAASATNTNDYRVTVTVTSGLGARARSVARDYTVTVRDVDTEAPGAPAAPTPGSATATSLVMSWTAPANAGPPISRYEVQYRAGSVGSWIAAPRGVGGASDPIRTSLTIRGLTPDTAWQVQVRAVNAEGTGGWSDPGTGMTAANAPPAFIGGAAFEVDENDARAGTVEATDPDDRDDVTGFALSGGDHALFEITGDGVLSFKSAPDFESPRGGADGDSNTYELTVTVTSGDGARELSAERTYRVVVRDVEEEATLTIGGYANDTVAENAAWTSPAPTVSGGAIGAVTWTLDAAGADAGAFTIAAATGVVSMVARDFESAVDANTDNVYQATVRATDADDNTATASFTVEVTDERETAALTVNPPPDTEVDENAAYSGTVTLAGGPVGAVTWAKGGPDAALFTLRAAADGLTATLALEAQDHERPADQGGDNGYDVTVTATDADDNTASLAITVTVRNVAEASTLTIGGHANATVAENAPWTSAAPTVSRAIGAVVWTLEGADAEDFTIVAATGVVSMAARDFEMPADANVDNVYEAVVRATDGDGNTEAVRFTVEVTDETEESDLTIGGYANATVAENTAWSSATPSVSGAIGAVTWTLDAAGADAEDFTIAPATGVVSMVARDFESAADADTDNVYEAVVRATDADGNTEAARFTVEVTDEPETAALTVIAPPDTAVDENAAYSGTVTLDGEPVGAVTWTKTGADAGLFTLRAAADGLSATLELAAQDFEAAADEGGNNVYGVTVTASDEDGNADAEAIAVTVRDVIEESTLAIGGYANATVAENAPWTSATPTVSGAIGAVTWSLDGAGADAGELAIAPATGVVSMVARDFEDAADANADNVYEAVVRVTDADDNTATARFTVEVTDEDEMVTLGITGLADAMVAENAAWGPVTATLTGDPAGAVTWTKSGADAALFTLVPAADGGSATLALGAQDFEAAADEGADHVHEVTVTATDADDNAASASITVEVTDVLEPPEAPDPPTLGAVTATGLVASWTEPGNTGPPISDYDVRWRESGSGDDAWTELEDATASTALMAALAGLEPSTSYEVQVRAENAEGPGDWSGSRAATTQAQDSQAGRNHAPVFVGVPYGFELAENADGRTTAVAVGTVSATDADEDDEVRYSIAAGNGAGRFAVGALSGALTYVGGGEDFERTATPLAAFVLTVRASDGTDATDATVTVAVTDLDEPPGQPAAVTIVQVRATSVAASWTAPANTGPPITGWLLEAREVGATTVVEMTFAAGARSGTLTGLTPETVYDLTVVAKSDEGDSVRSAPRRVTTDAVPRSIAWAGGFAETGANDGTVTGTVTATLTNDTFAADAVDHVTASNLPAGLTASFSRTSDTVVTLELTGAARDHADADDAGDLTVAFADGAFTGGNAGGVTNATKRDLAIDFDDNRAPAFTEDAPAARSFAENTAPGQDIGAPVAATDLDTGNTLTYSLDGTDKASFDIVPSSGQLRTKADVTYDYETRPSYAVTVVVDDGNGGTDSIAVTVTLTDVAVPSAPAALGAAADGETAIDLAWTAPAPDAARAPVTGYRVEASADGGTTWTQAGATDASTTTFKHTSLTAGTTRHYRVIATSIEGDSDPSDAETATTVIPPPAQVTNVQVTEQVEKLQVTWNPVTNATGYVVQWKSGTDQYSDTERRHDITDGTTTNYTIPALTPGTPYTVQVTATRTNAPDSPPSAPATGTPMAPTPAEPTNLQVTPGVEQLALTWNAVTNAGGYVVQWKSGTEDYSDTERRHVITDGTTTEHTITGLTAGTPYTVQVTATRQHAANGPASDEATATPMAAAPGQVMNVQVTPGVEQLALTWNAVTNAEGYIVQWKSGTDDYSDTERRHVITDGTTTDYTITGLTAGTEYTVRVIATRTERRRRRRFLGSRPRGRRSSRRRRAQVSNVAGRRAGPSPRST